jgi:Tfp pilus assembly protein PilO
MRRDRIVISVLVVAGILGAFWFGLLSPKRQEAQRLEAKLATQQQRLAKAQAGAAEATAARDRYNADYSTVALLGKAVPSSEGMSSLLFQLDSAAGDSRIDFRSLTNGSGAPGATAPASAPAATAPAATPGASTTAPAATSGAAPTPLPLSLIFSGSYMDMQRMLGRLDRFVRVDGEDVRVNGRLLSIDDIALSAEPGSLAKVKATITATAYTMPVGSAPTGAAVATGAAPGATAPAATASPTATASVGSATP